MTAALPDDFDRFRAELAQVNLSDDDLRRLIAWPETAESARVVLRAVLADRERARRG